MWIRGASIHFPYYREGGIIEEIAMRNLRYNPSMSYGIWDGVLYDLIVSEPNIRLLLNTTCLGGEMRGQAIAAVHAWQLTTYRRFRIEADFFADCSGDSILAEFSGAKLMRGREARAAFGESCAPERADLCTMGSRCLIQARETERPVRFTPPAFARRLTEEDFYKRLDVNDPRSFIQDNFWWIEIGGERDTLRDAEQIKHELLSTAYGVWDFIKNSGRFDSENWELDWVGFLSGKRESRRYAGDYVLSQRDLEAAGPFWDEVAYGGWSMDDHNPLGINTREAPNRNLYLHAPYAIPYRCLYSANVPNLFFAGRNVSVTHMALSSTRVMATSALMGQAVGNACALALARGAWTRAGVAGGWPSCSNGCGMTTAFCPMSRGRLQVRWRALRTIFLKTTFKDCSAESSASWTRRRPASVCLSGRRWSFALHPSVAGAYGWCLTTTLQGNRCLILPGF